MKYNLKDKTSLFIAVMLFVFVSCQKKENNDETTYSGETEMFQKNDFSQEERDWEEFEALKTLFCETPEECEKYEKGTFWYKRKFEDNLNKNRLRMARNFLRNYPTSEHYFDALKLYFSYLIEPWFMDSTMNNNKRLIVNQYRKKGKDYSLHKYQQFRTLPYNYELREKWLYEGDSLAQNFLDSNHSMEEKATIEIAVLGRDLRMAKKLLEFLCLDKKEEEAEYRFLFSQYYWKELIDQMDKLIFKYPDYLKWPKTIDQFITIITHDYLSPELREHLWDHFQKVTENLKGFKNKPVIAQVHKKAKENLKALGALKVFDESKPLQMEFTAMDGRKINLEDYHGKVVLLDFWSIRCGPCIKEMPHVRTLYDKYRAQGFEVIGISAEGDEDKERVLEVIQKQGANWPQLLDKGSDVVVSYHSLYKIDALPTVWLLNKDGVIVDKHARGTHLEPLIRKYLGLD